MASTASAFNGHRRVPPPVNEPIRSYAPGSTERVSLKSRLKAMASDKMDMPLIIGGKDVKTGACGRSVMPHDHAHVLGEYHKASEQHVLQAVAAARAARTEWASWSFDDRAAVILKAAELLTTSWRDTINSATMLGQSKTAFQAEIDSACEIIDFWRFNVHYGEELLHEQPLSDHSMWNQLEYRGLEGFVYAVTPFNFTSIAANLPTAPALMGNTVVWKPASSAMFSAYHLMKLYEAAGMPPGVINFVAGDAAMISKVLLSHRDLAGVHFTGSTDVFNDMWKTIGASISSYRSYPRIVGETGGKEFIVAHPSSEAEALAVAIVRGGFEFQGQKCSAVSRVYVPKSLWNDVRDRVVAMIDDIRIGDITDFRNFMGAVIDKRAFDKIRGYIDHARGSAKIVAGGTTDETTGYFVHPTLVETNDPGYRLLCEEIFGPVVTAYAYDDAKWADTLEVVDSTSPYALTGALFAQDRRAIVEATSVLRHAAGNFYINDKPTGAVVGQQPFGGARASGTNDKAGSKLNLMRWVSARTIKETFNPPHDYRYPFMNAE
jgi:1-pyrroline-5-carboxylate dehydrogenase